ncbi:MAG: response regulator [Ruminococcaceae bacterium]|nr:response regulator [Oscillospiraceae bacterium]
MSYKIMINGRNTVLASDIIRHTSDDLIAFSTSDVPADIRLHLQYFEPDAYVVMYPKDEEQEATLNRLIKLSENDKCKDMAFVIICDADDVEDIEKKAPYFQCLKITRPTSAREVEERTVNYIKALIRKRVEEEKKQQEAERAARARQEELKALEEAKKLKKEEEKRKQKEAREKSIAALTGSNTSAPAAAPASQPADPNARRHILIVDDDRNVLKLLKTTLSEKYEVTAMLNGKMAEKYLETKTADLILLDHEMPVESGLEVFQKIKENKEKSNIPVIFLTGTSDSAKIKEILSLHPRGYLLKPVNVDKLLAAIEDALK